MDIVEQLRKSANIVYSQDGYTFRLGLHNEAADEIEKLREERSRLREENAQLRELLQKWLGNCFVDVYGHGVTFGMGVRNVWAETRSALKDGG